MPNSGAESASGSAVGEVRRAVCQPSSDGGVISPPVYAEKAVHFLQLVPFNEAARGAEPAPIAVAAAMMALAPLQF